MASAMGRIAALSRGMTRNFTTTAVRRSHVQEEGIVGFNLPFSIKNRHKLAVLVTLYFSTGLSAPYIILRYNMMKSSG